MGQRAAAGGCQRPQPAVLIAHVWADLSRPFMVSRLHVDQLPAMGNPTRMQVKEFRGGHLLYARPDSQSLLTADVKVPYGVQ